LKKISYMLFDRAIISLPSKMNIVSVKLKGVRQCLLETNVFTWGQWASGG
jgi:hypothetical protein